MFFLPTAGYMSDVGELRAKYKQLLTQSETAPVYLLRHNQPQAVLLSMDRFAALLRAAESAPVAPVAPVSAPAEGPSALAVSEVPDNALGTADLVSAVPGRSVPAVVLPAVSARPSLTTAV